jgi:hypothetical protein
MPRFYFDLYHNDRFQKDAVGFVLEDVSKVRTEAVRLLPALIREEALKDGDRQFFTVLVSDEGGHPVYSATLNFVGLWLHREATKRDPE